jgi:transcription initiation factor TFIIB
MMSSYASELDQSDFQSILDYIETKYNGKGSSVITEAEKNKKITKKIYTCFCESFPSVCETNEALVCNECGLILDDKLVSDEPEWRAFNDEGGATNASRCGAPTDELLPGCSLGTIISGRSRMQKLSMWTSVSNEEKVIIDLRNKLNDAVQSMGIPKSVIRMTLKMFKAMINKKNSDGKKQIHRGKIREGLIAACFYYACKSNLKTISTSVIINIFEIDKKIFAKCCKMYIEEFNSEIDKTSISAHDLVSEYTNSIGLSFAIQKICYKILAACTELALTSTYSPQTVVAGIIYFVSNEMKLGIKKNLIIQVCDIKSETILMMTKILTSNRVEIFNHIKYVTTEREKAERLSEAQK